MTTKLGFGLTGLATIGANLARNVAHHGIPVAVLSVFSRSFKQS
jgi:6-phosphogluconate dehydrogenase